MEGKSTCNALKQVRKIIADNNGIEYHISECKYEGDCQGTCPKCEAEVRYIEQELSKRKSMGKKVVVAGLAAGIAALSSCGNINPFSHGNSLQGDVVGKSPDTITSIQCDSIYELEGDVAMPLSNDEDTISPTPEESKQ